MSSVVATLFFLYGLCFGSFYNVVGTRIPNRESIVTPPSYCDGCHRRLAWFELVPVLSWVFLGGRCRTCLVRIPVIYPCIELCTGLLFAAEWAIQGWSASMVVGIFAVSLFAVMVAMVSSIGRSPLWLLWVAGGLQICAILLSAPVEWRAIVSAVLVLFVVWYMGMNLRRPFDEDELLDGPRRFRRWGIPLLSLVVCLLPLVAV